MTLSAARAPGRGHKYPRHLPITIYRLRFGDGSEFVGYEGDGAESSAQRQNALCDELGGMVAKHEVLGAAGSVAEADSLVDVYVRSARSRLPRRLIVNERLPAADVSGSTSPAPDGQGDGCRYCEVCGDRTGVSSMATLSRSQVVQGRLGACQRCSRAMHRLGMHLAGALGIPSPGCWRTASLAVAWAGCVEAARPAAITDISISGPVRASVDWARAAAFLAGGRSDMACALWAAALGGAAAEMPSGIGHDKDGLSGLGLRRAPRRRGEDVIR